VLAVAIPADPQHCGSCYKHDSGTTFECRDVVGNAFVTARDEGNSCVVTLRLNLALGLAVARELGIAEALGFPPA